MLNDADFRDIEIAKRVYDSFRYPLKPFIRVGQLDISAAIHQDLYDALRAAAINWAQSVEKRLLK